MSLNLTNRLDKLENEIRIMLMLQKCGCQRFTQGAAVTTSPDGNIRELEISTNTQDICPKGSPTQRPSNKNSYPLKCTVECTKKGRRPYSPLGAPTTQNPPPDKDPDKCYCRKKSRRSSDASPEGLTKIPLRIPTPSPKRVCKCGTSPEKELEIEREKRKYLEDEIEKMKLEISELSQSKCMALTMTKQLKRKYEKVKSSCDDTCGKLDSITREKDFLCKCLERERDFNARDRRNRGDSGVQVDKDKGLNTIDEKEEKIKILQGSLMSLSKTVQEKDDEKKRLELEKEQMQYKLKKHKDVTRRLSETNEKLAKSVKKKHDSFIAVRSKAGKIQKEIEDYKSELRRSQLEMQQMKHDIEKQKPKDGSSPLREKDQKGKDFEALEEKLNKCKEKEKKASEIIQMLKQKIRDVESKEGKATEKEMSKLTKELKMLQAKYDDALNKLKSLEASDQKKNEVIANEMRNLSSNLIENQETVMREKEEMNQLIAEMTQIVKEQKLRIDELQALTEQQDSMIQSQKNDIITREERIRRAEIEAEEVREQCKNLDKELGEFKDTINESPIVNENKEQLEKLNAEIEELKRELDTERTHSATKDKVIEEQYNTIQSLKEQLKANEEQLQKVSGDARDSAMKLVETREGMERMSRIVAREQAVTKTVVGDLSAMQKHKETLEDQISALEDAYDKLSQASVEERKEASTISTMKSKYETNIKEWEEERKKLIAERDRAINAANLATETLMETMNDFQGQIKSQQQLQRIMTDMIVANRKTVPCSGPCNRSRTIPSTNTPMQNNYPQYAPSGMHVPYNQQSYPPVSQSAFYPGTSRRPSSTEPPTDSDEIPLLKCGRRLQQYEMQQVAPVPPRPISPTCRCGNPMCKCAYKRPKGSQGSRSGANSCSCKKRPR